MSPSSNIPIPSRYINPPPFINPQYTSSYTATSTSSNFYRPSNITTTQNQYAYRRSNVSNDYEFPSGPRRRAVNGPTQSYSETVERAEAGGWAPTLHASTAGSTSTTWYDEPLEYRGRHNIRLKEVVRMACRFCESIICERGMKAQLLADQSVALLSTDDAPQSVQLVGVDYKPTNCLCRIKDTACLVCGNAIGYHITQPCEKCLNAENNGHLWLFHPEYIFSCPRWDSVFMRPLRWGELPHPEQDFETLSLGKVMQGGPDGSLVVGGMVRRDNNSNNSNNSNNTTDIMAECGNPLLLSWLQEWMETAQLHNNKSVYTLRKACESMARYPTPFHHPREAIVLQGIGEGLVKRLEDRFARHCKELGEPMPVYGKKGRKQAGAVPLTPVPPPEEPKPKKPRKASTKQYVPRYRSGGFAILLALYQMYVQQGSRYLDKEKIIEVGQQYSEHSLSHAEHGSLYSAWKSMQTLIDKSLVYQNGKNFYLSGEGRDMAEHLKDVAILQDPSKAKFFEGPSGVEAEDNGFNNRRRAPSYSPEPPRPTKQPRPTPRSKPAPNRPAPSTYDDHDMGDNNGQHDDSDDDWGATAAVLSAPISNGSSSSSRPAGSSHQPLVIDNDWDDNGYDDNGYDDSSAEDYSSSQDGWVNNYQPSTSTSLGAKENIPVLLPDLSKVPMPVLLDYAEAQSRGTVPAFLNKGSTSTSTRGPAKTGTPKDIPDSFSHLKTNIFSTATGNERVVRDVSELVKFQPIYLAPGSFDIELILDVREVRVQGDRDYIPKKLKEQGVDVTTRTLDIGDVIWTARPKIANPLFPKGVVLDHIVERKRMDDLVSSIKDGRFTEQKFRLSRSGIGQVVYLIETYRPNETYDIPQEGIRTAMTTTQVHEGFFLKRTGSTDQTIEYLVAMTEALKEKYEHQVLYVIPDEVIERDSYLDLLEELRRKSPGREYLTSYQAFAKLNSKSETLTVRDNFVKMLMVIRGLSAEKAIEIAKVYGTPRAFFSALDKPGSDAPREERREIITKSGSNLGRKKIGPALANKVADLWYSETYEKDPSIQLHTYGS
ncbi:Crossover junction endonuclease mus81 [Mortierella sp. AD032]|nr:Crossover junction endonuclease mus81 [Mortierella sp. AD032]